MKISNRLKSLAGLVVDGDIVADIGCDHALLSIYLIKEKILDKIIVSDISENALNNAKENIKKYNCEKNVEPVLSDGLKNISDSVNTLIISGMGASTIIKILNNKKINNIKKLIIQSNNDYFMLRRNITKKGFYISHESVIYEKGKYYVNIVFNKGHKKYSLKELKYGPILMYSNKDYYEFLLKKQEQILDNIPKRRLISRYKVLKKKRFLRKLCK